VPVCDRAGARIFYEDRGDGPPVLLVHGGPHERMGGSRFWTEPGISGALITAGYRVILPDRRWSGGATEAPVVPHTWTLEAEDLAAVLGCTETGPALVVAGSNGCSAALRLAVDHGDLVAGLVLAWPVAPRDRRLEAGFERSAAFVASAGADAYIDRLRTGIPGSASPGPGAAFGVALTADRAAKASFALLSAAQAARLIRLSAAALFVGETVRSVSDKELRGLRASAMTVAVIRPSSDGPFHTRAVAEGLAGLTGARPLGGAIPESPSPEFPAARERFNSDLRAFLAAANQSAYGLGFSGSPAAPVREDEPGQHEAPEQ
jgi:pimeloyl-ACP methyl ester carboxylesterase